MIKRLLIACGLAAACFAVAWVAFPFPRERLSHFSGGYLIEDRDGRAMRVVLGPGDEDGRPTYVPRDEDWIVRAIVAAEDERFWSHPGVDPIAIARAMIQNISKGRVFSGASTLSTQVIRLIEPRPRTLWTKGIEAFRALQMERVVDKREILRQYLNRAPFGGNRVGIEVAAERYFGKRARDLSLAEAALLAGLPQSPSRLRPDRHLARALKRQAYVLDRMERRGMISPEQRAHAAAQKIVLRTAPRPFEAPHFCDAVVARTVSESGTIRTTLDAALQKMAERALAQHIAALHDSRVTAGAVVVIEVKTGAIRALAGAPDYFDPVARGQVNGALAERSAGSTLKPFAYCEAFDRGVLTPMMAQADVPRAFADYDPANFDGTFHGVVSARESLILSLNMPAVSLVESMGQPRFYRSLRELGFSTLRRGPEAYGLGLVLGNGSVRLLDLANAYACLARGGEFLPVRWREDAPVAAGKRLYSEEAAWLVSDILSGEERALDAVGHMADVRLPRVAWKTGTSSGFRDAWTVAYNPEFVVGVWVGNADGYGSPSLVGKVAAAPIAWDIFRRIYSDNQSPWFARPAGVREREVCAVSGQPPCKNCETTLRDWYIADVTPFATCSVHARGREAQWPPQVAAFLQAEEPGLRITAPAMGARFKLMDGFFAQQQIALASTQAGYWFVDSAYLGESDRMAWAPERGRHEIVVSSLDGRTDRVVIWVD
ncbi:MAG: penicillin-binding protein 1C [Kiritimatiellae bacterium]|nr:penicillin-binding protein 1C [Kiritimatiellia bacterium]MCO5069314.1 penicillin-binding protein 1C [Kiritimatiellia bacterium]